MARHTKAVSASLFFALFIALAVFSFISAGDNQQLLYAKLTWSLVVACIGLCIYRHGAISKFRSILFILIAFFFFLEFKIFRFLSLESCAPPYCHIALAPTLLNFVHSQYLALASGEWRTWGVLTMGFLWLLIMFTIGQGICSWVCFYGGWDEACSKLSKRPLMRLKVSKSWRDFPIAFLIFLLIISFLQGLPVFCNWFCPLKLTTAFWDSHSVIRVAQISFFLLFLAVFIVVLPILSKKRTFCSLICPFGALVSVCGKISPYRVSISKEKCVACGKCFSACPSFAIENTESGEYKTTAYCNRCCKCIDVCPTDAIAISLAGRMEKSILFRRGAWRIEVRDVYIFLALLMTGVLSGTFVPRVILQLMGLK